MPVTIDVIILSYAKDEQLKGLTQRTIQTLLDSEYPKKVKFNVLVVESKKGMSPFQYENSVTIYPKAKFGFNKFFNIGIKQTSNDYICFCNNDLIFHEGWASEIIRSMEEDEDLLSASTFCPVMHKKGGFEVGTGNIVGYENLFSGWCFFVKRKIFEKIGYFDEKFVFWYADRDYTNTLKKYGIKNALITKSLVTHLNSETSKKMKPNAFKKLTILPFTYYDYKWNHRNYFLYCVKYISVRIKLLLISLYELSN